MLRQLPRIFVVYAVMGWLIAPATAQKVALVIGNSVYIKSATLKNPVTDATDVSAALSRIGFIVTTLTNTTSDNMKRAVAAFRTSANGSEIALIFFAGHAVEVDGVHWSIPVDGSVETLEEVKAQSTSLDELIAAAAGSKFALLLLDTARENPFAKNNVTQPVLRDPVRLDNAPPNIRDVLVVFSTRAGSRPLDGAGKNSAFTEAVLKYIETPGLDVRALSDRVRDAVLSSTKRQQSPFSYGRITSGTITLVPR